MKKFFNHFEEIVSATLLFTVFFFFGLGLLFRLLGITAMVFEEITRYCYVVAILFGISYASKNNEHIRADIITSKLKPKAKLVFEVIGDAITILFTIGVVYYGIQVTQTMIEFPQKLAISQLPFWVIYVMLPITGVLTVIRVVQHNVIKFKGMKNNAETIEEEK